MPLFFLQFYHVIILVELQEHGEIKQSQVMEQEQSGDAATKIDLINPNGPVRLLLFVQQFWGLTFASADIKFYA